MESPEILLIPLVIGLMEVVKQLGLSTKFVPIATLALAELLGYFLGVDWITGLVLGLSSMGLWSGTKATIGK